MGCVRMKYPHRHTLSFSEAYQGKRDNECRRLKCQSLVAIPSSARSPQPTCRKHTSLFQIHHASHNRRARCLFSTPEKTTNPHRLRRSRRRTPRSLRRTSLEAVLCPPWNCLQVPHASGAGGLSSLSLLAPVVCNLIVSHLPYPQPDEGAAACPRCLMGSE